MNESSKWTIHMLAGLLIFLLLGMHMGIMHLSGFKADLGVADGAESAVSKDNSLARDANPLFTATYIVLLAVALYHGLYGLKNILCELGLKEGLQKTIGVLLLLLGLGLFGLGTWAAITVHLTAAGNA